MDWLVYPLRDILVWTFETLLEPIGSTGMPEIVFTAFLTGGLVYWLRVQSKYNAEAEANPDQIK